MIIINNDKQVKVQLWSRMSELDVPVGLKVTFVNVKTNWFGNVLTFGLTKQTYIEIKYSIFALMFNGVDPFNLSKLGADTFLPVQATDMVKYLTLICC